MRTFDASRILIGASTAGLARAALDFSVTYAKERTQFGKAIVEHQAVAFRLADMAAKADISHLLALRAAQLYDQGADVTREAAIAKLVGSENAMWCTWAAVQTLGGWDIRRSFWSRNGCATPSWRRSRRVRPTSSG